MIKKISLFIFAAFLLFVALVAADILFFPISKDRLDYFQRLIVDQIDKKWEVKLDSLSDEDKKLVGYDEMMNSLSFVDRKFAERIFSINPADLGFKGPFFSKDPASGFEMLPAKKLNWQGEEIDTGINFLPQPVFEDYGKMMQAMSQDISKELFVESGYRSPGYQAWLFFFYLGPENNYSLLENAKWIAMPGYSEHNSSKTAIDFINADGISGQDKDQVPQDFEKLPEYAWLQTNAKKFNFYQTYPQDNNLGVSFEPWHWHWEK